MFRFEKLSQENPQSLWCFSLVLSFLKCAPPAPLSLLSALPSQTPFLRINLLFPIYIPSSMNFFLSPSLLYCFILLSVFLLPHLFKFLSLFICHFPLLSLSKSRPTHNNSLSPIYLTHLWHLLMQIFAHTCSLVPIFCLLNFTHACEHANTHTHTWMTHFII